ncbi:MAG: cobalamin biosynthesis protein CobD [Bacteroidales bacterium]|nr:cobalamin biosynthesis protein CobD [Bacteroidales bacterium]
MTLALLYILPILIGWSLDLILGDPAFLPHPVVWFGKAIGFFEKKLNKGNNRVLKGALTAVLLIAITIILFLAIDYFAIKLHIICAIIVRSIFVFFFLAGTTLIREVREVFKAVDRSLEEGRCQVARIVGRDTSGLSAQEIRTAALETLAENLSDGVIAPLFWYLIGGLPAMAAYKMVNTLDSMIGYKTARYKDFGMVAAKIDDVANWIPARLTALLMVIATGKLGLLKFVGKYARCHASPNSGYPESALAGALDCRFGGPHTYFGEVIDKPFIGENEKDLTTDDMNKAVRINRIAETMMIILTAGLGFSARYFLNL